MPFTCFCLKNSLRFGYQVLKAKHCFKSGQSPMFPSKLPSIYRLNLIKTKRINCKQLYLNRFLLTYRKGQVYFMKHISLQSLEGNTSSTENRGNP